MAVVNDYTKQTGRTGTMLIRDTGTYVEYWINAGDPQTYNYQMPWAYVINGNASGWKYFRYERGSGYELLGRAYVSHSQTVTFKLGDTGTLGLGGPTTFSKYISRATVPSRPTFVSITNIGPTSAKITFKDSSNGGASIDRRLVAYGTNSSQYQKYTYASGSSGSWSATITGLIPGTRYYFWGRVRNSEGWSAFSSRYAFTTASVVSVNVGGVWEDAIPYVNVAGTWKQARPWTRDAGVWKEI